MRISEAELAVMDVVWAAPGSSAAAIAERIVGKDWSDKTVKTLLARLVDKGALRAERDGRRYLYHPLVQRAEHRRRAAGSLVDKLFGGRASTLVAHLADARELSEEDIDELEALVRRLKDDR